MSNFIASVSKLVGFLSVEERNFVSRSFTRGFSVTYTAGLIKEMRS